MLNFFKPRNLNKGLEEFNATEGALLIDVRSKDEYHSGHVPGSINIDGGNITKLSSLVTNKNTPLFVYCLSGARSNRAVNALKNMGYTQVKNIGGIKSYTGPIEKGN